MEAHVSDILKLISPEQGMGIEETPGRAARMWLDELTAGYHVDIPGLFRLFEPEDYEGIVVVKDIPVRSTCVHHLVPFVGYAAIGYVPKDHVLGLSKLARLVDAHARRLQIQENLTKEVITSLETYLQPKGAIVVVSAEHMCMTLRGVQAPGTKTITSDVCGVFETDPSYKEEFFTMLGNGGK
jgi:GTP cyclohydrolase I